LNNNNSGHIEEADAEGRAFLNLLTELENAEKYKAKIERIFSKIVKESDTPILEEDYSNVLAYLDQLKKQEGKNYAQLLESDKILLDCARRIKIGEVNSAALRLYGVKDKKELIENLPKLFPISSLTDFRNALLALLERQDFQRFRSKNYNIDGKEMIVDIAWSLIPGHENFLDSVYVMIIDVTQFVSRENAVYSFLERNKILLENSLIGFVLADTNGKIVDANKAYCEMVGYSKNELLEKTIFEMEASLTAEEINNRIEKIVKTGQIKIESSHKKKDGGVIEFEAVLNLVQIFNEMFVAAFLADITRRNRALRELANKEKTLAQLAKRLYQIREEERINIARELHDTVGQNLTALKLNIKNLFKKLLQGKLESENLQNAQGQIYDTIDKLIQWVRVLSSELRPPLLEDFGLIEAVKNYVEEIKERAGIEFYFTSNWKEIKFDEKTTIAIYRMIQEIITNAVRHSGTELIEIKFECKENFRIVEIEDYGSGFDVREKTSGRALGLLGLMERAELFNGRVEIKSKKGEGTKVKIFIPIKEIIKEE
jgi:PAS domain S-box-containing protein